ncbi:hypothetical protein MAPG_08088, partial [Magnaporthiopsis poae ATCC 64411]
RRPAGLARRHPLRSGPGAAATDDQGKDNPDPIAIPITIKTIITTPCFHLITQTTTATATIINIADVCGDVESSIEPHACACACASADATGRTGAAVERVYNREQGSRHANTDRDACTNKHAGTRGDDDSASTTISRPGWR